MRRRGKDLEKLQELVKLLAEGITLPTNHRDHPLTGPWPTGRQSFFSNNGQDHVAGMGGVMKNGIICFYLSFFPSQRLAGIRVDIKSWEITAGYVEA